MQMINQSWMVKAYSEHLPKAVSVLDQGGTSEPLTSVWLLMCPCTQYVSKSILIRFGVLKQRQNEWTSMSAGWQDLSVAGEKHMWPGAPVLHSAVDLHSVDVCLQDETWELEALLLVSKHLLCQSTRNFIGDDFFQKIQSLLAWNPFISMEYLSVYWAPSHALSMILHPSMVFFFFFLISMNASCFGWHRTFSCSFPSWLMYPSKHLYFSFLAIITPVMICFSCRL